MKNIVLGVLAHVDAGKTTLSEAMLYKSGATRILGHVDKGDAFLDTYDLERQRGITIFSKQAVFKWNDTEVNLLDTPGHIDFSAEMERTLQVLDYAILVINGSDGVQGHTRTLWELLCKYKVPVFIFVNKMDITYKDKNELMQDIKHRLDANCIDFTQTDTDSLFEEISLADEKMMELYLGTGAIDRQSISEAIAKRKIFPCYLGSALKLQGVEEFMNLICEYSLEKSYPEEFGAKIYKISRDEQGNRLTHMKITGGMLRAREVITSSDEKVKQIRIYSGEKYTPINEVAAGKICAVTGLNSTYCGQCLGIEDFCTDFKKDIMLEPVLMYRVILPEGVDSAVMLPKLKMLEEEEPLLSVKWNEELQEIQIMIMGEVQLQILKSLVKERFDIDIDFDHGNIVYKETINNVVEGVGHFEPLKHYAEVHLRLEPLETGSGLVFDTECSEDMLSKNWQRLIMTHLEEKAHRGVLTGSLITDMKITLIKGKAHLKHTEGGDFRQATYRAVRQGLKMAKSTLLEPYYNFRLEVTESRLGKAMTDVERMYGKISTMQTTTDHQGIIIGYGPVITFREYGQELSAYTGGQGKLSCSFRGYYPCHNEEEVVERIGYDSESDIDNPTGSVFCANGAGFYVSYDEVYKYMHLKNDDNDDYEDVNPSENITQNQARSEEKWLGVEEIDDIINRTYNANRKSDGDTTRRLWRKTKRKQDYFDYKANKTTTAKERRENYLLVDGYNVIFAWEDLKELAKVNIDGARGKLMDILCNYQAFKQCILIVVFDAYKVKGHSTEITDYNNIHVVFTKEAETADQYIEKFAHNNGEKYNITVATSDGLEQIIIRGEGCNLISSRELKEEIDRTVKQGLEYLDIN